MPIGYGTSALAANFETTTVAPDVGLVLALLTTPSGYRHSSATDECPPPAPLF